MNLEDFIKDGNELGLVTLESQQLKKVNGGVGKPVVNSALTNYNITPEDAYIFWYYEEVSE